MNKVFEIGAYVLASAVALGGGFVGADLLFTSGGEQSVAPAAVRAAPPPDTAEIQNGRYGFSFRHPKDWRAGPRYHTSVQESVGRRDGVFCYVSVMEKEFPSDGTGKPKDLRRLMNGLTADKLAGTPIPGAKTKVDSFGKATLGGQDARTFVLDAKGAPGAALQHGKLHGYATLRSYGAVFLVCVAPGDRYAEADVLASFRVAHETFRFESRSR